MTTENERKTLRQTRIVLTIMALGLVAMVFVMAIFVEYILSRLLVDTSQLYEVKDKLDQWCQERWPDGTYPVGKITVLKLTDGNDTLTIKCSTESGGAAVYSELVDPAE